MSTCTACDSQSQIADSQRRTCQVRYQGFQQGFGAFPGFELYNIVAGDGLKAGSTVTLKSLIERGYAPEVVS